MESTTSWSVEGREALAAVGASYAALVGFKGAAARRADPFGADFTDLAGGGRTDLAGGDGSDPLWDDPLHDLVDDSLDRLALIGGMEAQLAALKVCAAADYVQAADALAPPAVALHDARCQEMAVTAEVACALTVSEQTAGAFLGDCLALTKPCQVRRGPAGRVPPGH